MNFEVNGIVFNEGRDGNVLLIIMNQLFRWDVLEVESVVGEEMAELHELSVEVVYC